MKPFRVAVLILAVLAIGLGIVILRHGKSEQAYKIHQLHAEQLMLERRLSRHEAAVAAGHGPSVLRDRVERMRLQLEPPATSDP